MLSRSNKAESQYPGEKRSKEISLTTVGVIIVHGVETCQQQRDKRKLSSSKERRAYIYLPGLPTYPTIPDSCVIPCQAGMIARSPSTIKRLTCLVGYINLPFLEEPILEEPSLPNWKLKSRGDRPSILEDAFRQIQIHFQPLHTSENSCSSYAVD